MTITIMMSACQPLTITAGHNIITYLICNYLLMLLSHQILASMDSIQHDPGRQSADPLLRKDGLCFFLANNTENNF